MPPALASTPRQKDYSIKKCTKQVLKITSLAIKADADINNLDYLEQLMRLVLHTHSYAGSSRLGYHETRFTKLASLMSRVMMSICR
jgi:hypothetical protein